MEARTSLTKFSAPLVADTSAAINLIATGCAERIIRTLQVQVVAADAVFGELELGRSRGRDDADRFNELVAAGLVQVVKLGETGAQYFENLVVGAAADTLDDGEAATIAYALEHQGTALIDEKKATRLCAVRFPRLAFRCTADLLLHPDMLRQLGAEVVGNAVYNSLKNARRGFCRGIWTRLCGSSERTALCYARACRKQCARFGKRRRPNRS